MGDREPIGVIGTGYVGLVTAAGFAELGNEVWCVDIDASKIEALRARRDPDLRAGARGAGGQEPRSGCTSRPTWPLRWSTRACCSSRVGTPPTYSGDADLSAVHAVVDAMPPSDRHALVMKSTVPVGTGAAIKRVFAEQRQGGLPLRLVPRVPQGGHRGRGLPATPTAWSSATTGTGRATPSSTLYAPLGAPLVRTDIASAEMVKLASNAFLATKISFINEIANVCEETGANVMEVARGMGLDDRIGPRFLQPGIGFGGSCFPKDVSALKQLAGNSGYHFQLLTAVIEVNELQKRRVIGKLQKHLGSLVGKRVALLGLAFKPNTDDMREASSLVLAARLQADGARVSAYDPVAEERGARS